MNFGAFLSSNFLAKLKQVFGKTFWQERTFQITTTTSVSDVDDLRFSNLEIGKTYKVTTQQYSNGIGNGQQVTVESRHAGQELTGVRFYMINTGAVASANIEAADSRIFIATESTMTTNISLNNSDSVAVDVRVRLEELPNHEQTSKFL